MIEGLELRLAVEDFLLREAELLDSNRPRDWLELLDPRIEYLVPIRVTRERAGGSEFMSEGWHMNETLDTLRTRVTRLETDYAWAEDPPSRTRRFVTNIRVLGEQEDGADGIAIRSNLLLFRGRADSPEYELLSGERHDVLTRAGEDLRLRRRTVLLDHTTLGLPNLALFL